VRGGSWANDNPENLSVSYRNNDHPDNRNQNNGFRCVVVGGVAAARWHHRKSGAMSDGLPACPARAKKSPNRLDHAPEEPGKIRGGRRGR
jgi:hypothetical protein